MTEKEIPKRDQVLELLKEGTYTREQIADQLDMTTASVSSQFTYLRWMGNFIIYDEDKILSLVDQDEYDKWIAKKEANKKSTASASSKSPEEQAEALDKTIKNQAKQLENWLAKKEKVDKDLKEMPDDEQLQEMQAETDANITLYKIKMKRNRAKLAELPAPYKSSSEDVNEDDEGPEEEEEDLL